MAQNRIYDEWTIQEKPYQPERNLYHETIFTLANGYLGSRGNLEEGFSPGKTLIGNYLSGVFNDCTPQGMVMMDIPQADEMVNIPNWTVIKLTIESEEVNLGQGEILSYERVLDMKGGCLTRKVRWKDSRGRITDIEIQKFLSLDALHICAHKFILRPLNYSGQVRLTCSLDGDVKTEHLDHLEMVSKKSFAGNGMVLLVSTKSTKVHIAEAAKVRIFTDGTEFHSPAKYSERDRATDMSFRFKAEEGKSYTLERIVTIYTSRDKTEEGPEKAAVEEATQASEIGYDNLLKVHKDVWARKWEEVDVKIEGDPQAQQGIRYCIFQLIQHNAEHDPRVGIGPKGLSGELYKGRFFWDTDIFMLPFYIYTNPQAARNLELFRYNTIGGARMKAKRFNYRGAMYPMQAGIEAEEMCEDYMYDNFEQHATSAVAYGVWHYYQATNDIEFLLKYGAEIIIETARFWSDRVYFDKKRGRYEINKVTGPDEYCFIVDNNAYTNLMAKWNIDMALAVMKMMKSQYPEKWEILKRKISWPDEEQEIEKWKDISGEMYVPYDPERKLYLQDDNYLDLEEFDLASLEPRPKALYHYYCWDKIVRSQVTKQADVVLLMYLLGDQFDREVKRAAWDFYEPKTAHDSSLSAGTYAIMAAELGLDDKAYHYFEKSLRFDLDDVLGKNFYGLHTGCLGGSWQAVVNGFAGMRLRNGRLSFNPRLPKKWKRLVFKIKYRQRGIEVDIKKDKIGFHIVDSKEEGIEIAVADRIYEFKGGKNYREVINIDYEKGRSGNEKKGGGGGREKEE